MKTIYWQFSDYEIKKDIILLNSVIIGSHFKGVKHYGIEFHFENATIGLTNFFKKWQIADDFSENVTNKGKLTGICIRFGSPIINIWLSKKMMNKAINALNRYKINF
jgi:hypothetical protein